MLLDLRIDDSHEMKYRVIECPLFLKYTSLRLICIWLSAIRQTHRPQLKIFFFDVLLLSDFFRFGEKT